MGSVPVTPSTDKIRSAENASLSQTTMKHLSEGEALQAFGVQNIGNLS